LTEAVLRILPLLGGVILIAALLRLVPQAPRKGLRRSVILLLLYVVVEAGSLPLHYLGADSILRGFEIAGRLLRILLVINLAAQAVFDIAFRLARWNYPDILQDLAVGAAYLVVIGWLMTQVGFNITSVVATSAVVTAVLGLSLQATLGNIVGGLALQMDESFQEGDWIELENRTQGKVKKIRWRHTVLETRDWDTIIVPNGNLMGQPIRVLGRRGGRNVPRRVTVHFCVDFRYSPTEVIRAVNAALADAPIERVAQEPAPHCLCFDLAQPSRDSYALYGVRYWLTDLDTDEAINSKIRERIWMALKRAQIPLAIPAAALFISQDDPEHDERKQRREVASKRAALEAVDLFAKLSDEEKDMLAESAKLAPFGQDEIITRQGTTAQWLYVLISGRAEVRVRANGHEDLPVATLEAPSFFGEMALMTGQPREATVVALTDVECLRVDKADFQSILLKRPEIVQEISTILAQRRVELEAVREGLDPNARHSRMVTERRKILNAIKGFFGMAD
jgi:small-conductance mechanosensitive channel/CRP-like cAMP-binding protein